MQIKEILRERIGQKVGISGGCESSAIDVKFNPLLKFQTLTEVGDELFSVVRHNGKTCYYNVEHVRSIDLNESTPKKASENHYV